jgi:hypothetical protein
MYKWRKGERRSILKNLKKFNNARKSYKDRLKRKSRTRKDNNSSDNNKG